MRHCTFTCGLMAALLAFAPIGHAQLELHVALNGDDAAEGTATAPLATLHGARDKLRALRAQSINHDVPIHVIVHQGTYYFNESLELSAEDSGSEQSPIVFTAAEGEQVILSGGLPLPKPRAIDPNRDPNWIPEGSKSSVLVYDLSNSSIEPDVLSLNRRALDHPTHPASLELYHDREALPRSGWPNNGWATIDGHAHDQKHLSLPRAVHPEEAHQAWAHGFWEHDWKDSFEKLHVHSASDTKEHTLVSFAEQQPKWRHGARYRIENLLSELDHPGEWYFDCERHQLYVIPPKDADLNRLNVSHIETIVSMYEVEYVDFIGFQIESARCIGIELAGCHDVRIQNCEVRNIGNVGINIIHGSECEIEECDVTSTGSIGIRLEGGNRETLEPSRHICRNNKVHRCGYSYLARRPGIAVYGVGINVTGNEIAHLPDWGISIHGNEHHIANNEIHDVCRLTADTGAIYLAHDPTFRGNEIHENHIHHLGGFSDRDVIGIYLDDFASGTSVIGNRIHHAPRGIVIGGGRDNEVHENHIHDCLAAIQIDSRGKTWAKHRLHGEKAHVPHYCSAVQHDQGIYAERYPELASFLKEDVGLAVGNSVQSNVLACKINIDLHDGLNSSIVQIERNEHRRLSPDSVNNVIAKDDATR